MQGLCQSRWSSAIYGPNHVENVLAWVYLPRSNSVLFQEHDTTESEEIKNKIQDGGHFLKCLPLFDHTLEKVVLFLIFLWNTFTETAEHTHIISKASELKIQDDGNFSKWSISIFSLSCFKARKPNIYMDNTTFIDIGKCVSSPIDYYPRSYLLRKK